MIIACARAIETSRPQDDAAKEIEEGGQGGGGRGRGSFEADPSARRESGANQNAATYRQTSIHRVTHSKVK